MTREFIKELPYFLGEVYSKAVAGKKPNGFVMSMFERFAEAHAQGAIFFGPIAVIPQNSQHTEWLIKDLRGGWGFSPINLDIITDGNTPTLDMVSKELANYARSFKNKADNLESLISELNK